MFSRKTRKLSVAILMLIMAVLFGFCIINNCKPVNVNANAIEVSTIDCGVFAAKYEVYELYSYEVYPALPLEGELLGNNGEHTGKIVTTSWEVEGEKTQIDETTWLYTYKGVFIMPDGYYYVGDLDSLYPRIQVYIIDDYRPTVQSINDCTVNVVKNQKYTLPKTLKGTVDGGNLVDIAVTWNNVADTSQIGTKVYKATAVNSYEYKTGGATITANLTLNVVEIKHHYYIGENFQSMELDGYTFLGWANADNASLGVFEAGSAVPSEEDYLAVLVKPEYLGVSFRTNVQGVRFGFALKFFVLDNGGTEDNLKTSFVDVLLKNILKNATFTATIYGEKYDYSYTETQLKYGYLEEYQGYVSNLVFETISDDQLDQNVKVDAKFEIASKTLSVEGATCTIREKAQKAYNENRFGVTDQATIDKMVLMYGVKKSEG